MRTTPVQNSYLVGGLKACLEYLKFTQKTKQYLQVNRLRMSPLLLQRTPVSYCNFAKTIALNNLNKNNHGRNVLLL